MLLKMDRHGSKIDRNSVFRLPLSPVGRQMAIENSVSNDFLSTLIDIINVFDCCLPGVGMYLCFFVCNKIRFSHSKAHIL